MGFSFMTIQKVKSLQVLEKKYKHNYRLMDVANADPKLKKFNEELKPMYGLSYTDMFNDKINASEYHKSRKIRSNSVKALEIVTTFSREDLDGINIEEWKKLNKAWMEKEFNIPGKTDNVISMMFHADEFGNVHIHSLVIPIDERGALNASRYINGRKRLVELQNSYGKIMKDNFNLQRGLHGSKAKHQDIKRFYTTLNMEIEKDLPTPLENESFEDYFTRANEYYKDSNLKHLYEMNKAKRENDELRTLLSNAISQNEKYKVRIKKEDKILSEINENEEEPYIDLVSAIEDIEITNRLIRGIQNLEDKYIKEDLIKTLIDTYKKQCEQEFVKYNQERINMLLESKKKMKKDKIKNKDLER